GRDGPRAFDRVTEADHDLLAVHRLADPTCSLTVFEPTSITPTGMDPSCPPHMSCDQAPGAVRRLARIRPRMATSWEARRRSPSMGLARSHEPFDAISQAWELSERSRLKIVSISARTWGASTGTTPSMRWSRLRCIRSALPIRYVRSSPASKQ